MVKNNKPRFSVALPRPLYDRLVAIGSAHRPTLTKQFLVELAVTNLVDAVDSKQLSLDRKSVV